MTSFLHVDPALDSRWRAIILFGQNSASYKFALGSALLSFARVGRTHVSLEDLSGPYADAVCAHLRREDRQGTARSSRFLEACRSYNAGELSRPELLEETRRLGFANVIDAFHVVAQSEVPVRFFVDDRKGSAGIILTDPLMELVGSEQQGNLAPELEARWRLVETAWSLELPAALLAVDYDEELGELYVRGKNRLRTNVTGCRDALNGYQRGKCFYCYRRISVLTTEPDMADVDHFFPLSLQPAYAGGVNLNGIWNLVLSCAECNRGSGGKFDRLPALHYLERLHARNSYLIESHHPLRETLMRQAGSTEAERRAFLQRVDTHAVAQLGTSEGQRWEAVAVAAAAL